MVTSWWGAEIPAPARRALYVLRRDLLRLRNAVVPLVEVCRRLEHGNLPGIDLRMQTHFRDVTL